MKATNTTIYLTADENGIIERLLKAHPFIKPNKSAAIRYALFYWAYEPKCPRCGEALSESTKMRGIWLCNNRSDRKTHP